jgi:hypothetical protein
MTETAKERIYREALEKVSRSLPVNSELDLVIAEALIKAKYLPATTDKLSVEKLEPIGYYNGAHGFLHDEFDKDCYCQGGCSMEAVYTESQVKKLTDEKTVEKLQEQLNTTKKALTESEKMYQKQMDRFLNSEMNESARSHCESQLKLLFPAHKAYEALAAIGGDDE